jgi:hypothetical protein
VRVDELPLGGVLHKVTQEGAASGTGQPTIEPACDDR